MPLDPKYSRVHIATTVRFEYGPHVIDQLHGNPARYMLVERGRGGQHVVTDHDSPEDAARYSADQESAADWQPVELIDLDTNERYGPHVTITWSRQ